MTLLEHLENHGIDLRKTGKSGEYLATCPLCSKLKLALNVETGKFQCWKGCGGGFYISSLCKYLNIPQMVEGSANFRKLRQTYIEGASKDSTCMLKETAALPKEYKKLDLKNLGHLSQKAFLYLNNRYINNESIDKWQIGLCLTGDFQNHIIIPVIDTSGSVRTFQARRIFGMGQKSKNPFNTEKYLFNMPFAKGHPGLLIEEGPFDSIVTHNELSKEGISSVSLLGHKMTALIARQIARELKPAITWVALDPDVSRGECEEMGALLQSEGLDDVRICELTKDPDEYRHDSWMPVLENAKNVGRRKINYV